MQRPLQLTDDEMSALYRATQPIALHLRDAFLQDLADELRRYPEIGPGIVYRAIATLQRKYFDPPDTSTETRHDQARRLRPRMRRASIVGDRSPRSGFFGISVRISTSCFAGAQQPIGLKNGSQIADVALSRRKQGFESPRERQQFQ